MDILEKYRMIAVKRERLEYVYDQNRAQALRSAIPNPLGLLSAVQSFSLSRLAVSVVYMAVDSLSSYASNTAQADMQYLQNGWALDDEAAEALHQSRKSMFSYLVRSVDDYDLPGDLTLSESSVQDFVKWENNDNVERRIRFLEQNESTYCALGTYWIVLAESYYQNGQYEKCLNAISAYETMGTRLFRKDYEFARVLPLAIISAGNILPESEYIEKTVHYSQLILDNSNYDDWVSRYFVAQTYVDLFAKTKNSTYLRFAYELAKDNVNSLVSVQQELNTKYLAPIEKIAEPDGATKEQKADVKAYNNMLETNRKVELPPVSEPLVLNCELLFALADELKIDTAERTSISRILHQNDERLFLIYSLDDRFSVPSKALSLNDIEVDFDGKTLKIPAWLVPAESVISVTVKQASGETVLFHDWKLAKVDRKIEGELDSFVALFSSEAAKKHKFRSGDIVTISISLDTTHKYDDLSFVFEAKSEKNWLQIEQIRFYRES